MKTKYKKNKKFNIHQTSFYFEDFLESNNKSKLTKKNNYFQDRIYLLFFLFFSLILIFGIRITHVSLNKYEISINCIINIITKYFIFILNLKKDIKEKIINK